MQRTTEAQIEEAEQQLRLAMLNSDVVALDGLLAPGLVFTNHLGHVLGKEDDLASHRSGVLRISALEPSELQIRLRDGVAIVSARVRLEGTYNGSPASGDFRFTRVWERSPMGAWQVIAAHSCLVAPALPVAS